MWLHGCSSASVHSERLVRSSLGSFPRLESEGRVQSEILSSFLVSYANVRLIMIAGSRLFTDSCVITRN